jgi:hypothetical protein
MRGRALSALDATATCDAYSSAKDRLLDAAEIEIRLLAQDAARRGPDYALLITEAQVVRPKDAKSDDALKLACMNPTDPWVKVVRLDDLLDDLGHHGPGDLPETTLATLRPGVREDPPPGMVRCVIIIGRVFETGVAEIPSVAYATKGHRS